MCLVHFSSFTAKPGGGDCFQLLCLVLVPNEQGIKGSAAVNFKLCVILVFLDPDIFGVLLPGYEQKVLDFFNFPRYGDTVHRCGPASTENTAQA